MVFYIFGDGPSSWLIANNSRIDFSQLSTAYGTKFSTGELNGMNLSWMATGPNGRCFFRIYNGTGIATLDENLYSSFGVTADHVTFSTWGGWWVRNKNGSVSWGTKDQPISFINHTKALKIGHRAYQYVFFGYRDIFLYRYTNGNCGWGGGDLPQALRDKCYDMTRDGWVLGKNTSLCQYDPSYYFLHWIKGTNECYVFNVKENSRMNNTLVAEVVSGVGRNLQLEKNFEEQVKMVCQAMVENSRIANQAMLNISAMVFGGSYGF